MTELQEIFLTNLNGVCNLGGHFKAKRDTLWAEGEHCFAQNKFYFIIKGRCRLVIRGREYIAKAGDWFLIPPNTPHSYSTVGEPFEKYWMHFDVYPNADLFHVLNLPYCINVIGNKKILRLFSQFAKAYKSNELTSRIRVKALLLSLIAEYIAIACPDGVAVKSNSDSRIDEILRYIHSNLEKSLTNRELAEQFHLHANHFIRFFKNKTGQTPARYVKIKKMETAKQLLENSDLYINEIMEKIGEDDLSSFSRQFKSLYNQSPRKYRKYFLSENR